MAFFTCDVSAFPIVKYVFTEAAITDADFDLFLGTWEGLYAHGSPFVLIFDTTNMAIPNPKYCFKMSVFIKKIRRFTPQYLHASYIAVRSNAIAALLELIFYLQPPVAPVHLVREIEGVEHYARGMLLGDAHRASSKIKITTVIMPSKPFLPFL